jgi:hypothetical protein
MARSPVGGRVNGASQWSEIRAVVFCAVCASLVGAHKPPVLGAVFQGRGEMNLRLQSDQFTIESGEAYVLRLVGGRPSFTDTHAVGRIANNLIEGIVGVRPGDVSVTVLNAVVRFNGGSRLIPVFFVLGQITEEDIANRMANLPLGERVFLRIRATDASGQPPTDTTVVGISGEGPGTLEGRLDKHGEVDCLLAPGRYSVSVVGPRLRQEAKVVIDSGTRDAGVIEMRLP